MKKVTAKQTDPDLLDEYDFSQGVRGKYARRFAQGTNVVMLPPDVAEAFPTAADVHRALRGLMKLAQRTVSKSSRSSLDPTGRRQSS